MKLKEAEEIIHKYIRELKDCPCSISYHLNCKGGLLIHLNNVLKIARDFFPNDETLQALALIHDIGKARVYKIEDDGMIRYISNIDHTIHTINMIEDIGYNLTPDEYTAILFHHGGFSNYKPITMNELSVKLHFVDHLSTIRENDMAQKQEIHDKLRFQIINIINDDCLNGKPSLEKMIEARY